MAEQMLLAPTAAIGSFYDPQEPASLAVALSTASGPDGDRSAARPAGRLAERLATSSTTPGVPPPSGQNETENPAQRRGPDAPISRSANCRSMTARCRRASSGEGELGRVDPASTSAHRIPGRSGRSAAPGAVGTEVVISTNDYVHRWSPMRGAAVRSPGLYPRGPVAAGVRMRRGTARRGLKQRQQCRVVGIELDPDAAAMARKRIDASSAATFATSSRSSTSASTGSSPARSSSTSTTPGRSWPSSAGSRNRAGGSHLPPEHRQRLDHQRPAGRPLRLHLHRTACVGHLRFFTRRTIEEMLTIAGWKVVSIEPQEVVATHPRDELLRMLDHARIAYSAADLLPFGYHATSAENPGGRRQQALRQRIGGSLIENRHPTDRKIACLVHKREQDHFSVIRT